jgi:hypothetical protein
MIYTTKKKKKDKPLKTTTKGHAAHILVGRTKSTQAVKFL